jgi:hypothetical protein
MKKATGVNPGSTTGEQLSHRPSNLRLVGMGQIRERRGKCQSVIQRVLHHQIKERSK